VAASTKLTRRAFLRGALATAGLIAAGEASYRLATNYTGRAFDVQRSEALLAAIDSSVPQRNLPNIILILTDDLGYGDLGCFGSAAIETPVLDGLAAQGVRLTQFNTAAPLCSPSRAALLTGRYPIRTHITMPLYPAGSFMDIASRVSGTYTCGVRGIPEDEVLLPELLQRRGYRTALLGKWHLGDRSPHLPNQNGFDLFYGAYYSNNRRPYALYRDDQIVEPAPADQNTLTQRLTHEATAFIRDKTSEPFFLYYAQPFPHIPLHASDGFRGHSMAGLYGDTIAEIDWSVGQILQTLAQQGLDANTLVLFTSDNGPWWQGNAGAVRGRKNLPFEGGYRVPLIARWPGVLPAGEVRAQLCSSMDLYCTCLACANVPPPGDRFIDGRNILPLLQGRADTAHENLYYYKGRRLLGVRQGRWKYLRRHMTDNGGYAGLSQGPFLFDLETDPNESYSLIESRPGVARRMEQALADWEAEIKRNPRGWI